VFKGEGRKETYDISGTTCFALLVAGRASDSPRVRLVVALATWRVEADDSFFTSRESPMS
jgi:hypothetical protein